MLYHIVIKGAYAFCVFLEWLIWLYFISIWLLPDCWFRRTLMEYVGPLFCPVRKLLKKSVVQCKIDFSYIVLVAVIIFVEKFIKTLL